MVFGLEKFKEYFRNCTDQYVIIGGSACTILLEEIGVQFRATKDLDIVLIIEVLDKSFGIRYWEFIEEGGYKYRNKNTGKDIFYRFSDPSNPDFPALIELFSRKPVNMEINFDSKITPVFISYDIFSLSAILLNDAYYDLLLRGKSVVNECSVLRLEYILLFKMKAWLDFNEKIVNNQKIDSKDLKKHRNDILRLIVNISPLSRVDIKENIQNDILQFVEKIKKEKIDLNSLGIRNYNLE